MFPAVFLTMHFLRTCNEMRVHGRYCNNREKKNRNKKTQEKAERNDTGQSEERWCGRRSPTDLSSDLWQKLVFKKAFHGK